MARKEGIYRKDGGNGWEIYIDGRLWRTTMTREVALHDYESELDRRDKQVVSYHPKRRGGSSGSGRGMRMPDFSTFFRYLLRGFLVLVVIGALVILGIFVFNASRTGALDVYTDNVVTNLDEGIDQDFLNNSGHS